MGNIPTSRLRPLLERWIAVHYAAHPKGGQIHSKLDQNPFGRREFLQECGAHARLMFETGVDQRTIGSILREERPTVLFATADKLLTGIGRPDAWHVELADLYQQAAA